MAKTQQTIRIEYSLDSLGDISPDAFETACLNRADGLGYDLEFSVSLKNGETLDGEPVDLIVERAFAECCASPASPATVNALAFANSLEFPVFFYAGAGCACGDSIAILGDSELPVDLSDVEGTIRDDGIFEANNLNDGTGAHGWKFRDFTSSPIYKIQVFKDEKIWNQQNDDYNASA